MSEERSVLEIFRKKHQNPEISSISSLEGLEERHRVCPEIMDPMVEARYRELLKEVSSLEELEERYGACPENMRRLFFA